MIAGFAGALSTFSAFIVGALQCLFSPEPAFLASPGHLLVILAHSTYLSADRNIILGGPDNLQV